MSNFLFENAPVSLWEEDYRDIIKLLSTLTEAAKEDLHKYFGSNQGELDKFKAALKVNDVNAHSLTLFESSSKQELLGSIQSVFTDHSSSVFITELTKIIDEDYNYNFRTELETLRGNRFNANFHVRIEVDAAGIPAYNRVIVAIIDITDLHRSEMVLQKAKIRTEQYLNLTNVLFLSLNRDGLVTGANKKMCDMLNVEPMNIIGHSWLHDFVPDEERETVQNYFSHLLSGQAQESEYMDGNIVSANGEAFIVEWFHTVLRNESGEIVEIVSSGVDVTRERKLEIKNLEMETQLQQSQKLNSISVLARGVAHEINNPLTGLLNYANILEEEITDPELQEFAQGIQKEGTRVAKIVSNLLTFARLDKGHKEKLSVSEILDKALMLIKQSLLTDNIHLELQDIDQKLNTFGQIQELQQVILNILTNSWQALNRKQFGDDDRKYIRINVSLENLDDMEYVRIAITDNGLGIKAENINLVLDPFFSETSSVRRAGMGLAVAYGIVTDHKGKISIKSEYGSGTQVYLDLIKDSSDPSKLDEEV